MKVASDYIEPDGKLMNRYSAFQIYCQAKEAVATLESRKSFVGLKEKSK